MLANVANLTYVPGENRFYTEFFDPEFPGTSSPWVAQMDTLVKPLSPASPRLYLSFFPGADLLSATAGFTASAALGGGSGTLLAAQPVPEPASWLLTALGVTLLLWRRRVAT